jgi:hypothetical protein
MSVNPLENATADGIVQVHFADLSRPLMFSANEPIPQTIATVPSFFSRYFSEKSRWNSMKVVAESKVADPTEITLADPVFLRVRGPHALRVRRDPSLSSEHVGTLLAQNVFAFSEVKPGWAKLSPLHYADLQHSKKCCTTADFKEHDIQAQGYCVTVVDGRNVFETPSDDDIQAVLARVRAQSSAAGAKTVASPASRWRWPSDCIPSAEYSDSDDCANMVVYVKVSLPLCLHSDPALRWTRFLRCALYFAYATSAPHQRSRRALLLQVNAFLQYVLALIII